MKTIILALILATVGFSQTVSGQTSTGTQTVTFTLNTKKAPKLTLQSAACTCTAPNCAIDPTNSSYVIQPGQNISCTVTVTFTPPAPLPAGTAVNLVSTDPTQITAPSSVPFPTCAMTPCSATFQLTATP